MPFIHLDAPGKVTFKRLLGYIFRYKQFFPIIILCLLFLALANGALASIIEPIVDKVFAERDPFWLTWAPWFLFILFVVRGGSTAGTTFFMGKLSRKVIFDLRHDLFAKYTLLPTAYFDNTNDGELTAKMTYHVEQVAQTASRALRTLVEDSLTIVVLLIVMLMKSWQLFLFVFAIIPILMLIIQIVSKLFKRYSERILDSVSDITQISEESIIGHKVVKAYSGQAQAQQDFKQSNLKNYLGNMKVLLTRSSSNLLVQLVAGVAVGLIIYFASRHTDLQTGEFMAFLTALLMINTPIKKLLNVNEVIQMGLASAASVFEVLDEAGEIDEGTRELQTDNLQLSFHDVSFSYVGKAEPVLMHLNFTLEKGKMLALVGSSGSGKSTIASLIPRFYDVSSGFVLLNGHDIREYALHDLRRSIAYVGQDVFLFNDTIANNIAYACSHEYSEKDIIAAAQAAHVMEFVNELPEGLDTMVGDRGVLLSGGQRQRIAIARAIMKNAPILILDEATSALDTESERLVQDALQQLMQGRTTLVIAHRLSTVEMANEILVMENGQVIEQGDHKSLLARNGQYAKLQQLQTGSL
ncbi:MAG: lipid A export permease/ATP-binding protein MsbA [Gammaproteobacteria bacterium]|nr:lipid A export permease/ATP-binding protein MsbA [Gammaproteobacteria bacterium]NNC98411.1 lipid A export permease/ATP-binding protein MsbA [Gammaproteobacteria bacterium]NNM13887.1 lipid A export permease/ATP-binding protein MsbA [Gammaproteobacteria bacterium]